jgi:hypothetical protein
MPRKTVTGDAGKIKGIVNYFRTAPLVAALIALELSIDAVKERQVVGQRVAAGKAGKAGSAGATATDAVDAATRSAVGAPRAVAADGKARKKPGPKKGYRKAQTSGAAQVSEPVSEITDASQLPPQGRAETEPVLDLG